MSFQLTQQMPHQKNSICQALGRELIVTLVGLLMVLAQSPVLAQIADQSKATLSQFKPIRTQFIAALGDPAANSGNNAQEWGIWRLDPGPRGVRLNAYTQLQKAGGLAPAGWQMNGNDWWLEEHGLIMEQPDFPLLPGKYLVTGDRDVTTVLSIYEKDSAGNQRWQLAEGTLYDVTHLACRSARYTSKNENVNSNACSPASASQRDFPVKPGADMPEVAGCSKQDYAVLFIIGVAE